MKPLGRGLFWLLWPLVVFYSPLRRRTRALVVCDDQFLVVQSFFGSGIWQLPGGGIKTGESVLKATARELREETGLRFKQDDLEPLVPLKTYHENGILKRYVIFAVSIKDKAAARVPNHEIVDYEWRALRSNPHDCAPHVQEALKKYRQKHRSSPELLK